jgi:hypothetical protein
MYTAVRNLEWIDAEHTRFNCEVNFDHVNFEEWTPFTCDPNDLFAPYCKEIFDRAVAGDFGEIAEYVAPPKPEPEPEPIPVVDVSPTAPEPTKAELKAQLDALKAQLDAFLLTQNGGQ